MPVSDASEAVTSVYRATPRPVLVEVPTATFLMIDGAGDPTDSRSFADAMSALYAVSWPIVMELKRAGRPNLKVPPLEGLWSLAGGGEDGADPGSGDRTNWRWTLMIRQPDAIPGDLLEPVLARASAKVGVEVCSRLRFERFAEGRSAQILHRGPYSAEAESLRRLHAFIADAGLRPCGRHHEIYLGDPRRAAPERLRTILRQPVCQAGGD